MWVLTGVLTCLVFRLRMQLLRRRDRQEFGYRLSLSVRSWHLLGLRRCVPAITVNDSQDWLSPRHRCGVATSNTRPIWRHKARRKPSTSVESTLSCGNIFAHMPRIAQTISQKARFG